MNNGVPIRVLHVVTQMNRNGLESRIMDIYRHINRNEIQFDFLTHRQDEGHFDDEIRALGGKVYYQNPIRPHKFLSYIQQLQSFFREHPYEIVHAHLNSYSTWVLLVAKKYGATTRIAHSRNSGMDFNIRAIFKYLSRLLVNIPTTHRFACSRQAGVWLFGKHNIQPPKHFHVVPNGFDVHNFTYSAEKRTSMRDRLKICDKLAVVHVGRFSQQKNHAFLLQIYQEIQRLSDQASVLYLFGIGELEQDVRLLVEKMGLENSVVFMGNQNNVFDYLQAMDIMIFPSIYEGFGTVVIESQCIGLPTLASTALPPEVKITNILNFLSVKQKAQDWARLALEMYSTIPRESHLIEVQDAGYDIEKSHIYLESFYRDCV